MDVPPTTTSRAFTAIVVHPDATFRVQFTLALSEAKGWRVHGVSNGGDGVRIALTTMPQLVLLDPYLRGMDGAATIATLRAHGITCPVVALVQHNDRAIDEWQERGFVGALELCDGPEQLVPRLQALLDRGGHD